MGTSLLRGREVTVSPATARLRNVTPWPASRLWRSVSIQPSCCMRSASALPMMPTVSPFCSGSCADAGSAASKAKPSARPGRRKCGKVGRFVQNMAPETRPGGSALQGIDHPAVNFRSRPFGDAATVCRPGGADPSLIPFHSTTCAPKTLRTGHSPRPRLTSRHFSFFSVPVPLRAKAAEAGLRNEQPSAFFRHILLCL